MTDLETRALTRHAFHGDWNYTPLPAPRPAPPQPPADLRHYAATAGITIPGPPPRGRLRT